MGECSKGTTFDLSAHYNSTEFEGKGFLVTKQLGRRELHLLPDPGSKVVGLSRAVEMLVGELAKIVVESSQVGQITLEDCPHNRLINGEPYLKIAAMGTKNNRPGSGQPLYLQPATRCVG